MRFFFASFLYPVQSLSNLFDCPNFQQGYETGPIYFRWTVAYPPVPADRLGFRITFNRQCQAAKVQDTDNIYYPPAASNPADHGRMCRQCQCEKKSGRPDSRQPDGCYRQPGNPSRAALDPWLCVVAFRGLCLFVQQL